MTISYTESVSYLEGLQIMPKTMPGLQKIKSALKFKDWYSKIDTNRVIVVAGTNGKGTTCAALECLLLAAGQKVGFYSSPHLISTNERIRVNGLSIDQDEFVHLFRSNLELIQKCELSHFEALTLMACDYFFNLNWNQNLDFIILEVGLGGTFDATNAIPHKYSIITKLGIDHVNILGNDINEIASNKFGIISEKNIVVHHKLPDEVYELKKEFQKKTNSNWVESEQSDILVDKKQNIPRYFIKYNDTKFEINVIGKRSAENIMTALTLFQILGFNSEEHCKSLNKINWQGRMQQASWSKLKCPLYLSGDHNEQGVDSLLEILNDFKWTNLHLIVGIGIDKAAEPMLQKLSNLNNMKLYLTETPFKGLKIDEYPLPYRQMSVSRNSDVCSLLNEVSNIAEETDMVLVTGSLYLVGEVLKKINGRI